DSRFQPLRSSTTGLSSSTAQLTTSPLSAVTLRNTCTCGLRQSTAETMPSSSIGRVASNLPEIGWCAYTAPDTASATAAASRRGRLMLFDVIPFSGLVCVFLMMPVSRAGSLTADFERATAALVLPRADDRAVRKLEVLDAAFDLVVHRATLRVLVARLDLHDPAVRIQRRSRNLDVVGAGIDDAGDLFAVPVHDEQDELAVHVVRLPGPDPGALDRMPFLSNGRNAASRGEHEGRHRRTRSLRHHTREAPFDQLKHHTIASITLLPPHGCGVPPSPMRPANSSGRTAPNETVRRSVISVLPGGETS